MDRTDSTLSVAITPIPLSPTLEPVEKRVYHFVSNHDEVPVMEIMDSLDCDREQVKTAVRSLRRRHHLVATGRVDTKYGPSNREAVAYTTLETVVRIGTVIEGFRVVG